MKNFNTLFFILIFSFGFSQQVQWANKVLKFSSDLGGKQNGIKRILGKPDAFPQGGNSANAWTPKNALDGKEVVEVEFEKPQTVKQIAIFENLNAGSVIKIMVNSGSGKYETVWTRKKDWITPTYKATFKSDRSYYFKRKRRKVEQTINVSFNPGIEYIVLDNAVSGVVSVKIEFNFALLPGQKQIDAIGISDSEVPIVAQINTRNYFESLAISEIIFTQDLQVNNPIVVENGTKLLLSATKDEKEIIYYLSKNSNGKWSNPLPENPALNTNNKYNYIESYNSNFILKNGLTYQRGTKDCGYEFLKNNNGNFESLGKLQITAFSNYDDNSDATITNDGKTLLLGIESDMTQGGNDIYFTTKKEDGTYNFLENAGKIINSAADEGMPFLLSDTKTLLFCSNGFSSYGNHDIYVTQRLDDSWKKWSEPINLGSKINSSDFDGSPFYDESSETLYFITFENDATVLKSILLPKNLLTNAK